MTVRASNGDGVIIAGIGRYAPPQVRSNEVWPADVVRAWTSGQPRTVAVPDGATPTDADVSALFRAMAAYAADPFHGSRSRRVMGAEETTIDMEVEAAVAAMGDAGVAPSSIGLILHQSNFDEHLSPSNVCALHRRLGLATSCMALTVDAADNSFLAQVAVAVRWIASGAADTALLVQSSAYSRLLDYSQPYSPYFGDAATAVVLARSAEPGVGVLAIAVGTDGRYHDTRRIEAVPGAEDGSARRVMTIPDPLAARQLIMEIPRVTREAIGDVLASAGVAHQQVDFFACHQATVWLRSVIQERAGLSQARSLDTFSGLGSVNACNVPAVLFEARARGEIAAGDVVVMCAGGAGMTWTSLVMRWGAA